MKYSLRQIEVFLATARHQNISRAAEELAMSQSAASGALKDLEQRYDAPLFDRVGKRLQLNMLGSALRPQAEALLSKAEEVEAILLGQHLSGTIRVGATMTIGNYLMVPLVSSFKRRFPEIDIELHVANTTEIAQQVVNFELDVGFLEGEYRHHDLNVRSWKDDELVVFCSPKHPLAEKGLLDESDLGSIEWILREPGSGTRQAFDQIMAGKSDNTHIFLELEHTEAIKLAVELDLCLGFLSRTTVADALKSGRLCELQYRESPLTRQLYLISRRDKHHFPALTTWLSHCDIA